MKEAQVLHLLQLQSIELHVGNKQTQLRDNACVLHTRRVSQRGNSTLLKQA